MINSCVDLWYEWMGEKETPERAKALLKKWVFKGTDCGCVFGDDEKGVYVGGYAEGSPAELPPHRLEYPFKLEDWNVALSTADEEGVEEWKLCNEVK